METTLVISSKSTRLFSSLIRLPTSVRTVSIPSAGKFLYFSFSERLNSSCSFSVRLLRDLSKSLYTRSEEHTSELQSRPHLVCRLLLEKKKISAFRQRPT